MSFPTHHQLDAMDCGPSCLKIVAEHYGRNYSLARLRDLCHITREGVSLLGISDAAEAIGFRTIGAKITFEQLVEEVQLPCIVHWNQNHFVVVYDIEKRGKKAFVHVSDPAGGLLKYTAEQFCHCWLQTEQKSADGNDRARAGTESIGVSLLLEPTPKFYSEQGDEQKRPSFGDLFKYLRPYKSFITQLLVAMLVGSVISLIMPFLSQSVIDVGIGNSNQKFIVVMLVAQLVLVLGQLANELIRSWLMLHMTTRVSISLISDFLTKLMRLPISFFDSKNTGDIMQRIDDHSRIQNFLTGSLLSIVMASVTFVVYSVIMGFYDWKILGVFALGSVLYVLWVLLFLQRRRKLDYMRFQESASNQSTLIQLVDGMQEIKLNNCEKQRRWEWERIQARLFNVSVKSLSLGQTQKIGATFIDQAKNILISFLSATAVIKGDMTLGMMTAVQYIIGQLNAPISEFIGFMQDAQDAKISFERLGEIQGRGDEEEAGRDYIREIPDNAGIELKNVTFQYGGPHSEKVLDNVSIDIPCGKTTAIVGASGSGKTTMLKLMLGFYEPVEGEVLLGGNRVQNYSPTVWRANCGTVMQDGFIFSDSIENNIAVSEEVPDRHRVRDAAMIANVDGFITRLPLGYNTKVGSEGNGLSMGQKQRILIARAAYKGAPYLFFDEATNSLDANNEAVIMKNLDSLFKGRTVVVVAHRLSTVKNADNIIVIDQGKVVEQGTHRQLTAKKGYYYELVRNQLELGS